METVLDTKPAQAVIKQLWEEVAAWNVEKINVLQELLEGRREYEHFQERWVYCDKMIDARINEINLIMATTLVALFPERPWRTKPATPSVEPWRLEGTI